MPPLWDAAAARAWDAPSSRVARCAALPLPSPRRPSPPAPSVYLAEVALQKKAELLARERSLIERNLPLIQSFFARHQVRRAAGTTVDARRTDRGRRRHRGRTGTREARHGHRICLRSKHRWLAALRIPACAAAGPRWSFAPASSRQRGAAWDDARAALRRRGRSSRRGLPGGCRGPRGACARCAPPPPAGGHLPACSCCPAVFTIPATTATFGSGSAAKASRRRSRHWTDSWPRTRLHNRMHMRVRGRVTSRVAACAHGIRACSNPRRRRAAGLAPLYNDD